MSDRPNVLLLVADQHRYDWLEGHDPDLPVRTPNLSALAARGTTFTHASTPSPLCAPARACLAAGVGYDASPVRSNAMDLPAGARTYYRLLRDGGYHVAGVGKHDLHKATLDWNLDGSRLMAEWGFSDGIDSEGKFDSLWSGVTAPRGPYMKHLYDRGLAAAHIEDFQRRRHAPYADTAVCSLPADAYLDNWIAANAHAVLDRRPRDVPWHLVVNFAGPHDPMDVTEEMRQRWDGVAFPGPVAPGTFAGDHQEVRRRYAAMIENIDARVGELLTRLEAEGDLANTVVIYTSDHGEMLGDHGTWGKQVPLEASTRIPLVVAGPGVRAGARTDALVSLEDIGATTLALAGLAPSAGMTAQPFTSVLAGETDAARPYLLSGLDRTAKEIEMAARHYGSTTWTRLRGWRSIATAERKLVVSADLPEPVLLDISAGRDEPVAARPGEVERLLAALRAAAAPAESVPL